MELLNTLLRLQTNNDALRNSGMHMCVASFCRVKYSAHVLQGFSRI